MRRLSAAFVVWALAALPGRATEAQITLIPGPQHLVAAAPKFISSADFNKDGIQDAVVTNTTSSKVTVLTGSREGTFSSAIDFSVGRTLRGLRGGDMNSDGNPDVVVVNFIDHRVLILAGQGDGTFRPPPASFPVGQRPIDVAIGNFDGVKGNDVVTANQTVNRAAVLLNLGGNAGFVQVGDPQVGKRPKRVATADLNGDGFDDLLVVNIGTRAADDLSVLLNNGVGGFSGVPLQNFVVGAGAKDLAIVDVSGDGVPDVLVLNTVSSTVQNEFSVSVLVNQTEIVDGTPRGKGFFDIKTPVTLRCPASISGVLIQCNPNFIAAADLDLDGAIDFAVSFSTRPTIGTTTTPGLVQAFAGRGDGSFDFATQVSVGLGPEGIEAADFTGDGVPDLAVAERGAKTVRIIRSLAPPPRPTGTPCTTNVQCSTTFCTDRVCCETPSCPAGQRCDIPDHAGQCDEPGDNGDPCDSGVQCQSSFCVDGSCCRTGSCPEGQFCNSGDCSPPSEPGTPCTDDQQCRIPFCVNDTCCETPSCPSGQRCDIPGFEGTCSAPSPPGTGCDNDEQCTTGHCLDQVCCVTESCPAGQVCNVPGREGTCLPRPTATRTPTVTPTPQPAGAPCANGAQCQSGNCVDGVCCSSASCPTGQACRIFDSVGTCAPRKGVGQECRTDSDCDSGNCEAGNPPLCGGTRTATPTRTPTPRPAGFPCDASSECATGFVCSSDEGVCCRFESCPAAQSCAVQGRLGECTDRPTPTRTPTPEPTKVPTGISCDPDNPDACESGFCTDDVCCETDLCPDQDRCDIAGFEGECHPPLLEGDPCEENTDCEDPLLCVFNPGTNRFECVVPPEPTPTFFPFTPKPTQVPPDITISRGGGCSIGRGPDGAQVWAFCVLPLALWLRRRRVQRVRAQRDTGGRRQ